MEFLRFGSSIPGSYWGCCAVDIIQNFKVDPAAKASIQLAGGDSGQPILQNGGAIFFGPTWEDVFWQRLRIGTFSQRAMPNHAFIAILTEWQVKSAIGKKWLAILRRAGFEFIRAQQNSVYTGDSTGKPTAGYTNNVNYIFGLFRNIGTNGLKNPFVPPSEWTELEKIKPEFGDLIGNTHVDLVEFTKQQHEADLAVWNGLPEQKFYSEQQLIDEGVPVIYAGKRSEFPQQEKSARDTALAAKAKREGKEDKAAGSPSSAQPAFGAPGVSS